MEHFEMTETKLWQAVCDHLVATGPCEYVIDDEEPHCEDLACTYCNISRAVIDVECRGRA